MQLRIFFVLIASCLCFSNSVSAQVGNPYADVLREPMKLEPGVNDDSVTVLLKQSFTATHKEMRVRYNYWLQDIGEINAFIDSINRLHRISLEISPDQGKQLLESKLAFAREIEKQCEKGVSKTKYEALREINEASAQAFRAATELELAKFNSSAGSP